MRTWIDIVETKSPKSPSYEVVHYDGPKNVSSDVVDRTVIRAATKDELHRLIKAWMDEIGLDPDDEDDLNTISWKLQSR